VARKPTARPTTIPGIYKHGGEASDATTGTYCAPWLVLERVILADWRRRTGDHLKPACWLRGPASREVVERQYAAVIAAEAAERDPRKRKSMTKSKELAA
jgi:hypothetical protein